MGRRTRVFATLFAILGSVFAVVPGHATTGRTLDVELYGSPPTISPSPIIAQKGDVIRFSVINGARFQLVLQDEAGGDTPIDSGLMDGSHGRATYQIEFGGGTVRFYDSLPSTAIVDPNTGVCTGACGVITDESTTPIPPVIDQPTRVIQEDPATITGTAEPMTIVTLTQGLTVDNGKYQGQALTDKYGKWTVKTVDFGRGRLSYGGTKNLIARAVRAVGWVSPDSAVVQYSYSPDLAKPKVLAFDGVATPPIYTGSIQFSGTVLDNVGIGQVAIVLTSTQVNTTNPVNQTSLSYTLPAFCATPDPNGCAFPSIAPLQLLHWSFDTRQFPSLQIPSGLYQISAVATDTSGNIAKADAPSILGNYIIFSANDLNSTYNGVYSHLPNAVQTLLPSQGAAPSPVPPVIPTPSVSVPPTP